MQILNSTAADIDEIFRLYDIASEYQRGKKTVVVWPKFERRLIEQEIAEHRQWKLMSNNDVTCVWATTFSDAEIWEERNADKAVYIHRIATNPAFRGENFVKVIVDWAREYASTHGIDFIRLDTLGENWGLINHYQNAGFEFLGFFQLKNTIGLPDHYQHGLPACLFEIDLRTDKIQS